MANDEKKSSVERIKESSNLLRGEIAAELTNESDHFGGDSVQLLKHHGAYQQDNRDDRAAARAAGDSSKHHSLMVRTRVPGGRLTAEQLLGELDLCDELGSGTLRLTSRQSLQLHGVLKRDLREVIRRINATQLTTLGACGDLNRNTMCCPAPYADAVHGQLQELAVEIAESFAPRTGAYRDIWLVDSESGEKQVVQQGESEPLYGNAYLPRKFKIGIALPQDNCIDVYTHDVGLLAVVEGGQLVGFNALAGGGMGVTPSNKKTFPALGSMLAFVTPQEVIPLCRAIIEVQRELGNRENRKIARLKYLIHELGFDAFRQKVADRYGRSLVSPHATDVVDACDHLGWEPQGDGRWFYGLNVENGRLADTEDRQWKSAIREICRELSPGIRVTAYQSMLFTDIEPAGKERLESILADHHLPPSDQVSIARRWSMACVAWPTCGLAITESERALPEVMDQLEAILERLGLQQEAFTVRMTGCPNGCVRPYNADVGIVGKARGRYTLMLGGNRLGTRLNRIYRDLVPLEDLVPVLEPLLEYFQRDREAGESFGDFCHRKGNDDLAAVAGGPESES